MGIRAFMVRFSHHGLGLGSDHDNISLLQIFSSWQNNLRGYLPPAIGNLTKMQHLQISGNMLIGEIPKEISNLVELQLLDLSSNSFSGSLYMEIFNISGLREIDLSYNNLSGSLPSNIGGPFKNLSRQFFIYNEALCGFSGFSVPPCPTSSKHKSNRKKLLVLYLLLGITLLFSPFILVCVWIRYKRRKRDPQQTDSLSNLVGSGSFGSVYKGILRSETAIAVKVFNLQVDEAFKSFDTECEVLRNLLHRNLVKVITYCSNVYFKALVLEYMPNGSLDKYLYSHNYLLDIKQRLSIMIDVTCALEYLHRGCSSPVIQCDLKPCNVLLDEYMVAHLSDFGISKLLGDDESDLYTKIISTLGYIAPEYGQDGLVSTKCDVYIYGIMLLETFTRRKPNQFEGDLSLKLWVSCSLQEAVMDIVDANLLTSSGNRLQKEIDVVASIMKVALDCCVESPTGRTNMKDVVGTLQKIKIQLLAC
ncbi:hypothetical protein P3S67_013279 [Capsicum chacoense]